MPSSLQPNWYCREKCPVQIDNKIHCRGLWPLQRRHLHRVSGVSRMRALRYWNGSERTEHRLPTRPPTATPGGAGDAARPSAVPSVSILTLSTAGTILPRCTSPNSAFLGFYPLPPRMLLPLMKRLGTLTAAHFLLQGELDMMALNSRLRRSLIEVVWMRDNGASDRMAGIPKNVLETRCVI